MMRATMRGVGAAWVGVMIGCAPGPGSVDAGPSPLPPTRSTTAPPQERPEPPAPAPAPEAPSVAPGSEPIVLVTDPAVLADLERRGLAAGPLAFGGGDPRLSTFAADAGWTSIRATLQRDLAARMAADPKAGVTMRSPHRAFDPAWLASDKMRLELVAVTNRIDRLPFDRAPGRCGEVRMIYRLAYATSLGEVDVDSRLPMTVNVVFWQPGDDCSEVARRWLLPENEDGRPLADALLAGPLAPTWLGAEQLKSVEVNLQTLRWPGVIHPSLGGHAEYELRVFRRDAGIHTGPFHPTPLENTPDVDRIAKSATLRAELRAWVDRDLEAIDAGIAVMPESLATDISISVTPRGLARLANRPFSQLLSPADLDGLALGELHHTPTSAGLLRRLDELSCHGCHETRSIAGFHIVGEPRDPAAVLDTLAVAVSAHLSGDLTRRREYVLALAQKQRPSEARPLSDFESVRGYGAHCGLGDLAFASWTCAPGLRCATLDDPLLGTCLPEGTPHAGDPCELGVLATRAVGHRDRVRDATISACSADAVCNVNAMGFPTGMCTAGCGDLAADEACGPIVDFTTFNRCVGQRRPFPECIEKAAHGVGLRACDHASGCRDDYVCARSAWDARGACLPPYFLFQLRVDGHVL